MIIDINMCKDSAQYSSDDLRRKGNDDTSMFDVRSTGRSKLFRKFDCVVEIEVEDDLEKQKEQKTPTL